MRSWGIVAGVYLAVTLVMATSFIDLRELSTASFENDGRLIVWTLAWATHAIRGGLPLFAANIYFPAPDALAYTEHMLGIGLLALPLSFMTSNPVLVFSVLWLAAFWTNAMAAHWLALRFTGRHLAAVAGGLVFAWTFFRNAHLAHLQLQWTAWLPLSLVLLERWFRQPTWGRLLLVLLVLLVQMLTSWYMAVIAAIVSGCWILWLSATLGAGPLAVRMRQLAVAAAIGALVLVPLALPYVRALVPEPAENARGLSADLATYLSPPEDTWVGRTLERHAGLDARWIWGEQTLFLGWTAITLALVGGVATVQGASRELGEARASRLLAVFFIALTIAGIWLSLGPAAGRVSPYTLVSALPGVSLFRAPARFALLVILGVSVLAAIGLKAIVEPMGASSPRRAMAIAAITSVLMLAEWRVVTPVVRAQALPVPAIYSALRGLPGGAVMSLPDYSTGPEWFLAADYLLFSTAHWRPIVNGFGRAAPPEHAAIVERLTRFPSADSAALARRIGVRYFVVHTDRLRTREPADAARRSNDFVLRAAVGPDYLFEVAPDDSARR